jgi:hypothetical protein
MINLIKKLLCKIGRHNTNNLKIRLGELEDIVDMDLFPWYWPDDRSPDGQRDFRELMRRYALRRMAIIQAYFSKHGREELVEFLNKNSEIPSRDFSKYCQENNIIYPTDFFEWHKMEDK